jgi:4-hydroxybenzoate polyprenyltransferase
VIARARLLVVMARPAVVILLGLYAAIGAGGAVDPRVSLVVAAFLLFSVAVNDLADEAIDRVNLPGAASRPLVTGTGQRFDLRVLAGVGAVVTAAAAVPLGWRCVPVAAGGLVVSVAYSRKLSGQGAVASLVLPACYVAVPYLLGAFGAGIRPDLMLMTGLYVGFVGRILLKDFRDVRGDALFGKRTFLVRHGRRATCAFSACCWVAGAILLAVAQPEIAIPTGLGAAGVLVLLRMLATDGGHRRDERLISAIAIVGRGLLVVLLVALTGRHDLLVAALTVVFAVQATAMVRQNSRQSMTIARSSPVLVGTSRTRNAAPPR